MHSLARRQAGLPVPGPGVWNRNRQERRRDEFLGKMGNGGAAIAVELEADLNAERRMRCSGVFVTPDLTGTGNLR